MRPCRPGGAHTGIAARVIERMFHRGVALAMDDREIQARSPEALRDALAVHHRVSTSRLAELGGMSDRTLAAQATALDALAARLATDLAADGAAPASVLARVHAQDTPLPGDWADAVATARQWPAADAGFQRTVLESLAHYLAAERACVRVLLTNRERANAHAAEPAPRQQRLIDPAALAGLAGPATTFHRLTKGDPLAVHMTRGQALELLLAHHRFLLVSGSPWLLVDDMGEDQRLRPGRSVVGRSAECEAMVHESYRAISRRHAVLEIRGTESVIITDVSSLGTFVPDGARDAGRVH